MAQFALGDIKYTKRAANNTVHREKLHGAIHFGRHKITQRAVNNTVHQAKLTDIGQLTLDHIHAHTHTCSEISYRITVVECIGRAQTIP